MNSMPGFRPFLEFVTATPEREACWLDMLSQMEYVGCRKIMKAVRYDQVDLSVLQHAAEEASHAFLLKEAAARLGRGGATWKGAFSEVGWKYFKALDTEVSALQNDGHYPAVSWAIERRVMELYPAYLAATQDPGVRTAVSAILAQEKRHGAQFDAVDLSADLKREAAAIEARLWDVFHTDLIATFKSI